MLHKTRGIVFRYTRYGETSIIVNIFTEHFGLQSYIVNGVRAKTAKSRMALYQPLTLLDLVVYHRENANILRIREVKCLRPYVTIHNDIRKTAIAMFLNEVMNKAVRDQSHAEELCEFLIDALSALDELPHVENFHLIFMIQLSRLLGFGPQAVDEVVGGYRLSPEEESALEKLLAADFETSVYVTYGARKNLLDSLIRFYAQHVDNFGELKSTDVLKDVLN